MDDREMRVSKPEKRSGGRSGSSRGGGTGAGRTTGRSTASRTKGSRSTGGRTTGSRKKTSPTAGARTAATRKKASRAKATRTTASRTAASRTKASRTKASRTTGSRSSSTRGSSSTRSGGAAPRRNSGGAGSSSSGRSSSGAMGTGGGGPDAIRLLTNDHRTVDRLLAQAQGDSSVVELIRTELEAHATVEEEIFYPAVRDALKEKGREMVDEAVEEHNEVRDAIDELAAMDAEDEDYNGKLEDLKQKIQHHVKEEEGEMFPQARQALSQEQLTELGSEMESRKEELKSDLVEV